MLKYQFIDGSVRTEEDILQAARSEGIELDDYLELYGGSVIEETGDETEVVNPFKNDKDDPDADKTWKDGGYGGIFGINKIALKMYENEPWYKRAYAALNPVNAITSKAYDAKEEEETNNRWATDEFQDEAKKVNQYMLNKLDINTEEGNTWVRDAAGFGKNEKIDWEYIRDQKDEGAVEAYNGLLDNMKSEFGHTGWFDLKLDHYDPNSNLKADDYEELFGELINIKANQAKDKREHNNTVETIKLINSDYKVSKKDSPFFNVDLENNEEVAKLGRDHIFKNAPKEKKKLFEIQEKIREHINTKENIAPTIENTAKWNAKYKELLEEQEKALANVKGTWGAETKATAYINYETGTATGTATEGALKIPYDKFEFLKEKIEGEVENMEPDGRTHKQIISDKLDRTIQDLYLSDARYSEKKEVVINDHRAWEVLMREGYQPVGKTEKGFIFDVPYGELAKWQNAVVNSDGTWTGWSEFTLASDEFEDDEDGFEIFKNKNISPELKALLPEDFDYSSGAWQKLFKSPDGHMGLLEFDEDQAFDSSERQDIWGIFAKDQDRYAADDLSKEFKINLARYSENREKLLTQKHVLADMDMFNIDPASYNDTTGENIADFFLHTGEVLGEGFIPMLTLGEVHGDMSKENSIIKAMSNRKKLDVLQTISNETGLALTDDQKEEIQRGLGYDVWEGVMGFVPVIAEFAAIEYAMIQTGNVVGAIGNIGRTASKIKSLAGGTTVYRNAKTGKRLKESEMLRLEKGLKAPRGTKAFNEAAARVGIKHAVEKSLHHRAMYHTYMGVREEIKMKAAFDEHYHMGGGVAFYGVGRLMNKIWKPGTNNILNTVTGWGKSGIAGAISVQAAQNLEAIVKSLRNNQSYMLALEEMYPDTDQTFRDMLVDYFVFGAIGAKGWMGGSKGLTKGYAWKSTESLRKLKETADQKIEEANKILEKDPKNEDAIKQRDKYTDLWQDLGRRLDIIDKYDRWQNPIEAEKMMNRAGQNYLEVFRGLGYKNAKFKMVNNEYDMGKIAGLENKEAAASITKDGQIVINTSKSNVGKIPHEVTHHVFEHLFGQNPAIAQKFKNAIKTGFKDVKIEQTVLRDDIAKKWKKGDKVLMNLEQMIKNQYGGRGDFNNIKAPEYVAYAAEILANPRMYAKLVTAKHNTYGNVLQELNRFGEQYIGKSLNKLESKQDIIDFLGNFAVSVKSGTMTAKQVNMFRKVKNEGIYNEIINFDGRNKKTKAKDAANEATENQMNSKDILLDGKTAAERSKETQRRYESSIEKTKDIDETIKELLAIDSSKPSVGVDGVPRWNNKEFGAIVYNVVDSYNAKRPREYQITGEAKYDLVMDLVYDLNGGGKRGLENIIKKYHEYTPKEGEVKQPLTKTVMQQLNLRIHEIKERGIDQRSEETGGEFGFGIDMYDPANLSKLGTTEQSFEFKSKTERLKDKKGIILTSELRIPTRTVLGLNTKARSNIINFEDKGRLPSFEKIAELNNKESKKVLEEWLGINPNLKPSEYYQAVKDKVFSQNDIMHKSLPLTSHPKMYENSNVAKTIFKELYEKTGEKYTYAEMPTYLTPKERASQPLKWRKKDINEVPPKTLYNIIYKGSRKDVHAKGVNTWAEMAGKVLSSQVTRKQLNNPAVQNALGKKNFGLLESLKIDQVVDQVKESIKGSTPKGLWSVEFEVFDKFKREYKNVDWSQANYAQEEVQRIINTFPAKERVVLEKYKDQIVKEMNYNLSSKILNEFAVLSKAQRELGNFKTKDVDVLNFKNWKDFAKTLNSIKGLEGHKVGERGWNNNKQSVKEFDAFMEDLYNSMPKEIFELSAMKTSTGAGQTKFLGERRNKDWTSAFIKKLEGNNEKVPEWIKEFRIINNGTFKKNVDTAKNREEFNDLSNPKVVKKFADYIKEKYLTRKGTKIDKTTGKRRKITWEESVAANEKMQEYIYLKLREMYVNAKPANKANVYTNIWRLLQIQTSIGNGFSRGLPTHNAITSAKGVKTHSEHELQVINFNANFMKNMIETAGSKEAFLGNFRPIAKQFKQSIIEKEIQEKYDGLEEGGKTGNIVKTTGTSQKANFMRDRVIAETTIDLRTGKTYDQMMMDVIGASKGLAEINKIKESLKENGRGYITDKMTNGERMQRLNSLDIVLEGARKPGKKKRKGISVFDFDQTLANTKEKITVIMPDGKTSKIGAAEFAKQAEALEAKGAKFDFSQFEKVVGGTKGPLADLALKRQDKFGSGDIYVLTARPQTSAVAIHKFLKGIGLDIPIKNITGLENGTPEAKSGWIAEKAKEGYNDFYFADDAYKNVRAVKDLLDAIDVKGKVQQALNSVDLNKDVNMLMEDLYGISSKAKYSDVQAKLQGGKASRGFKFIPSSHQDFKGLLYDLLGSGKQGDLNKAWWQKNFIDKYNRGTIDIANDQVRMIKEFKQIKKELVNGGIPKNLNKEAINGFSYEQAIRVATWVKQGMDVPGMSKRDLKSIVDFVEKNKALNNFSQRLIEMGLGSGYAKPSTHWLTGTITTDLMSGLNTTRRAKYLKEWQDNVDVVFSHENLNKMEAKLGTKWRESMENMLERMKTGKSRSHYTQAGSAARKMENQALDWLNNSVGTIMFLNSRSAVLQTISNINYINWKDNNPLMAGKAILNLPQYSKDFVYLINSDFMKQRRGGLEINVAENEIADAAKKGGGVQGVISYMLNKGFILTRGADSFAIASGGATFFRNRTNTYIKQGMSKAEAEKKAFEEFRKITEETQQSSRADMISMQQASTLGRTILAFANTPSQYARLIDKAGKDLINGRGSKRENLSKIAYYGFVQNLMFNAMQNALFALMWGDDEDENWNKETEAKKTRIVNGMADSILRGTGVYGAAIATLKNMVLKAHQESQKDRPKYVNVATELLDISPPLSSKISKLQNAGRTLDYDMKTIRHRGFSLDNPAYLASANYVSALTNIPLDRAFKKYNNISAAAREDTEMMQDIALLGGWSEWELGITNPKEIEEAEIFKQQGIEKAKRTRELTKKLTQEVKNRINSNPESIREFYALSKKEQNAYIKKEVNKLKKIRNK